MRGAAGWGGRAEKEKRAAMPSYHIASGRRRLVPAVLGLLLGLAALAGTAHAACENAPEAGNWRNTASQAGSIASIQIACEGEGSWSVRASGTCERASCDWGRASAQKLATGQVFASYGRRAARINIYAKVSRPGLLQVYTWTSYSDGRPDRESTATFAKQEAAGAESQG
jgi:hypothetical protein